MVDMWKFDPTMQDSVAVLRVCTTNEIQNVGHLSRPARQTSLCSSHSLTVSVRETRRLLSVVMLV